MGSVVKDARDAKPCPKCGKWEYRFNPDIGWYCSNCHYRSAQ